MSADDIATVPGTAIARRAAARAIDPTAPLEPTPDVLDVAREHIAAAAFRDGPAGSVGLELELHLVDLARPARRPAWSVITDVVAGLGPLPGSSPVTLEPGGQIELSTPPSADVATAIADLQTDLAALRRALAEHGLGAAAIGADPARPLEIVNPSGRYAAMAAHYAGVGCSEPGLQMMTATAALQVNLDAGPRAGWQQRLAHVHALGPVFVALAASSPMIAGTDHGWRSHRQRAWAGIDQRRAGRFGADDPAQRWAQYALDAPLMLVTDHATDRATGRVAGGALPVTRPLPLRAWLSDPDSAGLPRRPALRDLDVHLSTLFPPVRPRGYLELRVLDALPDRWWPAVAAIVTTLVDDPATADAAADIVAALSPDAMITAARDGLADPQVHDATLRTVELAARAVPDALRPCVEACLELVQRGRAPGDEVADRLRATDPISTLQEYARA